MPSEGQRRCREALKKLRGKIRSLAVGPPLGGQVLGLHAVEIGRVHVVDVVLEHPLQLARALGGQPPLLLGGRRLRQPLVEGVLERRARRHVPHLVLGLDERAVLVGLRLKRREPSSSG